MTYQTRALRAKTPLLKKGQQAPQWLVFDAKGKTLGRFAAEMAKVLRGKHKPTFTPHVDSGDGVIIINAADVYVSGAKEAQKLYRYYTGSMSGLREIPYRTMKARQPAYILRSAIKGMMPRTRLGRAQLKRLRIFAGAEHNMVAQTPQQVNV